jgi:hypothetical protein
VKFTQEFDHVPDNGLPLGEAIELLVTNKYHADSPDMQIAALTKAVAAIAQRLPPWEQKQVAIELGLVPHNG